MKIIEKFKTNRIVNELKRKLENDRRNNKIKNEKRVNMFMLKGNKDYNIADNILKPLKLIEVEKDKIYEIETPFYKEQLFFKCVKAGNIMVKYRKEKGKDVLLLKGSGVLQLDQALTEGLNTNDE